MLSGTEIIAKLVSVFISTMTIFFIYHYNSLIANITIFLTIFRSPPYLLNTFFLGVPTKVRCSKLLEEALRLAFGCYAERSIAPAGTSTSPLYISSDIEANIEFMIPLFVVSRVNEGTDFAVIALDDENVAVLKLYRLGFKDYATVLNGGDASFGNGNAVALS